LKEIDSKNSTETNKRLNTTYAVCCGIVFQKHSLSARITTHLKVTFRICAIHC